ncbi:9187_t:CDS:1, partial [Gigaspora rosea]
NPSANLVANLNNRAGKHKKEGIVVVTTVHVEGIRLHPYSKPTKGSGKNTDLSFPY